MQSLKRTLGRLSQQLPVGVFRELCDCLLLNRPIRYEAYLPDIPCVLMWKEQLGLNGSVGSRSFRLRMDEGIENWSSSLTYCNDGDSGAMRSIYLHSDQEVCEEAKRLDERDDDYAFGLLLGYPRCCVDAYVSWQSRSEGVDPIVIVAGADGKSSKIKTHCFPNPFSRYFGAGSFSHFPCSLECSPTRNKVTASLDMMQQFVPALIPKVTLFDKALVVFERGRGVCMWTRFEAGCRGAQVDVDSFYGQGELVGRLRAVDRITICPGDAVSNEVVCADDEPVGRCFVAAFNSRY